MIGMTMAINQLLLTGLDSVWVLPELVTVVFLGAAFFDVVCFFAVFLFGDLVYLKPPAPTL